MAIVGASTRMAFATVLCLSVHGCEDVNGGAVELSWKLRPASSNLEDKFVDCDSGKAGTRRVERIRLDWQVEEQQGFADWPCTDSHGATGFQLPAGHALLTVSPVCEEEEPADPASYIAPGAEQRRVIVGDTVSLGAVELVVVVSDCGPQRCICM